jgi:hypothetical protein
VAAANTGSVYSDVLLQGLSFDNAPNTLGEQLYLWDDLPGGMKIFEDSSEPLIPLQFDAAPPYSTGDTRQFFIAKRGLSGNSVSDYEKKWVKVLYSSLWSNI